MMKNQIYNIGDLVKHNSLTEKLNRGYGVVVDVLLVDYDKINTIKCMWYDGKVSWVHKGQLKIVAKGQKGERS